MASADPSEELVSREEKPLDSQGPPKTAPRVISTIPISPNSSAPSLGATGSAAVAPLGPAPAPAVAPPEPTAESVPLVAATGAPGLPELKKIHTVAIRSDLPDSVGDALATPMVSPWHQLRYRHRVLLSRKKSTPSRSALTDRAEPIARSRPATRQAREGRVPQQRLRSGISPCRLSHGTVFALA